MPDPRPSGDRPRLFLHGHQHRNAQTSVGQTQVIGVHGHRVIEVE